MAIRKSHITLTYTVSVTVKKMTTILKYLELILTLSVIGPSKTAYFCSLILIKILKNLFI